MVLLKIDNNPKKQTKHQQQTLLLNETSSMGMDLLFSPTHFHHIERTDRDFWTSQNKKFPHM